MNMNSDGKSKLGSGFELFGLNILVRTSLDLTDKSCAGSWGHHRKQLSIN